ncbi:serine/threonine-protein kinase [Lentisphaera profundi]|uniref:Serine/threonine-protein kinase n=1 Tax=Lentisphaera profundi TaxID=1658616 RepID=A0ABY7VXX8_9BACT|nr:serine/threonine-protein kinase [Lentisphaera profundi]WDE97646.1 serine/threonine-protein kinase [Lentisphaera profundi]
MRKEDKFNKNFGQLFEEAFTPEERPLEEALRRGGERYSDFDFYREGGLKQIRTCLDQRTGRRVAMATMKPSVGSDRKETFIREARINAALQHPNIVPVYDVGLTNNEPWFTMKFIEGQSLKEIVQELKTGTESRFNNLAERLELFLKVCDAVAYAHSKGILHLDLKPDNIRVSEYGDVVLCDWGLADIIPAECEEPLLEVCSTTETDFEEMTLDGVVKGSPGYMAPEQTGLIKERKGKHTDIFSLGAVLYTLLTYEKAFTGKDLETILHRTVEADFIPPSRMKTNTVPYSLEAVCIKALSKKISDRYTSIKDLQGEVRDFINGFTTEAENASLMKSLHFWVKRNRTLSAISLIAFCLLLSLLIVFVINLKLAESNAKEVAEKLRIEKEYHMRINRGAAPKFFERAQTSYKTYVFDDALNFCSSAVELDETLIEAWKLKANIHFIRQEFKAAQEAFEKADDKSPLAKVNAEYAMYKDDDSKPLNAEDYLNLVKTLRDRQLFRQFANLIHYKIYSDLTVEERIAFCKEAVILHNYPMEPLKFYFDKQSRHLDLSGNLQLEVALCFQNFPAESADFSNTKIPNFICFRGQKLKYLDVSHTEIYELHSLENADLIDLNLSHTGVSNLTPLEDFSIRKLNISHTQIKGIQTVLKLNYLQELIVHKGQFSPLAYHVLPKTVKVIEVD